MSWISVEDGLPENNTLVAWLKMNNPINNGINKKWVSRVDSVGFAENHNGYHKKLKDVDANYWMPLPEPPQ